MQIRLFKSIFTVAAAVVLLAACQTAQAPDPDPDPEPEPTSTAFYAVTRGDNTFNSDLYYMDDFGLAERVGDTGYSISSIKFDPTDGVLYGTTRTGSGGVNTWLLVEFDLDTGVASTALTLTDLGGSYSSIAFRDDGALFAFNESGDNVYTIDKTDGTATLVGNPGISSYSHAMWFDADDVLWFINGDGNVYTIDTTTGAGTLVHDRADWIAPFMPGSNSDFHMRGDLDRTSGEYWGVGPAYGSVPASAVVSARINAAGAEILGVEPVQSALAIHHLAFPR